MNSTFHGSNELMNNNFHFYRREPSWMRRLPLTLFSKAKYNLPKFLFNEKVIDLEQKSKKVQNIFTTIFSNLFKNGDSLVIETPSLLMNLLMLDSVKMPRNITLKSSKMQLSSICDMKNTLNCTGQTIILKVFFSLFMIYSFYLFH